MKNNNIICEKCNSKNIKTFEGFNNYFIPLFFIFIMIVILQIGLFDINSHLKRHLVIIFQILLINIPKRITFIKKRYYIESYFCKDCSYNSLDNIKKIKVSSIQFGLLYLILCMFQIVINFIFVLKIMSI